MKKHKQLFAMISATFILVVALTGMTIHASTDYYTTNPKIIRTKRAVTYYRDSAKLHPDQKVSANHFAKITKVVTLDGHAPVLKTNTGKYVTANKQFVVKTSGYQNPKQYYQVQYHQIKPHGQIGYTVKRKH